MGKGTYSAGCVALLGSAALALALSACDGGPATKPARDQASASAPAGSGYGGGDQTRVASNGYGSGGSDRASGGGYGSGDSYDGVDHRKDPVALFHGKPRWASSRKYAADESAEYHFKRDGADFDAKSVDDFVQKAHAFVDRPPKDVLILTRDNGDKLMYDAHGNVFAVVTKDGAPRTMFKPRDGQAYWDQQKQKIDEQSKRAENGEGSYHRRSYSRDDDNSDG